MMSFGYLIHFIYVIFWFSFRAISAVQVLGLQGLKGWIYSMYTLRFVRISSRVAVNFITTSQELIVKRLRDIDDFIYLIKFAEYHPPKVLAALMLTCQLYQDYQALAWFSELTTDLSPDLVRATHAWTLVDMDGYG